MSTGTTADLGYDRYGVQRWYKYIWCGTAKQEPVKNKSEKTVKLKCHVSNDIMHATILIWN